MRMIMMMVTTRRRSGIWSTSAQSVCEENQVQQVPNQASLEKDRTIDIIIINPKMITEVVFKYFKKLKHTWTCNRWSKSLHKRN